MATKVLAPSSSDFETELLIAQLLEDDLATIENGTVAEQLQLNLVLYDDSDAANISRPHSQKVDDDPDTDGDVATRVFAESAGVTADAALAQSLVNSFGVGSYQLAQKLITAEMKIMLDAEFAKRLQAAANGGEIDTDAPEMQDAGRYVMELPSLLVSRS